MHAASSPKWKRGCPYSLFCFIKQGLLRGIGKRWNEWELETNRLDLQSLKKIERGNPFTIQKKRLLLKKRQRRKKKKKESLGSSVRFWTSTSHLVSDGGPNPEHQQIIFSSSVSWSYLAHSHPQIFQGVGTLPNAEGLWLQVIGLALPLELPWEILKTEAMMTLWLVWRPLGNLKQSVTVRFPTPSGPPLEFTNNLGRLVLV